MPSRATRAFIDIGTNSVRMVIVRFSENGSYEIVNRVKEVVRLGEGEFVGGELQPEAMDRAIVVCRHFSEMARANGADGVVAVATAATREARNRRSFLERLDEATGINVRTVSGPEEARLIYLGVANGVHLVDRTAIFIDIGGGSTEIILGGQKDYRYLDSLKVGAIRLANLFPTTEADGRVPGKVYKRMSRHVRDAALRSSEQVARLGFDAAVGSSGSVEHLADIAVRMREGRPRTRDDVLRRDELHDVSRQLRKMTLDERRRVPGVTPGRAEIIVPGAAILETLMDAFGVTEITVSDRGLREGLIVDHLARHNPALLHTYNVRERSVVQLGRACRFDEQHAHAVRRLAVELFDGARAAGLHEMGTREREILEHAAMLHDIGTFLSHSRHERHAYYMIRNAQLLGFDESEIAEIAAIARFHRKGYPRPGRPELVEIPEGARDTLPMLSTILRVAESLDRSHAELVSAVTVSTRDSGEAVLTLHNSVREPTLELWGARAHRKAFRRAFGRQLVVEAA